MTLEERLQQIIGRLVMENEMLRMELEKYKPPPSPIVGNPDPPKTE
jgi:hypothetical protein